MEVKCEGVEDYKNQNLLDCCWGDGPVNEILPIPQP